MTSERELNAFYARCGECGHVWPALYLPMELAKACKVLKRVFCPKCATSGRRIFWATGDDIAKAGL
jgi:hypothetical protein